MCLGRSRELRFREARGAGVSVTMDNAERVLDSKTRQVGFSVSPRFKLQYISYPIKDLGQAETKGLFALRICCSMKSYQDLGPAHSLCLADQKSVWR